MDQSYSLFTLIFKGVHEPFGFDSLLLLTFLRSSRMLRISGFILDGVYFKRAILFYILDFFDVFLIIKGEAIKNLLIFDPK